MLVNYGVDFVDQATVVVPGSVHQRGTAALRVGCYSAAGVLQRPESLTVHPVTFDVVVAFGTVLDGWIVINGGGGLPGPEGNVGQTFTNQTTVTIPGTSHRLGTKYLLVDLYDAQTPAALVEPGSTEIDPTTFDVTLRFIQPQSGYVVLCGYGDAGPAANVSQVFVEQTLLSLLGTQHGLGTRNLGITLWDEQIPAQVVVPGQITVHPNSFDVLVTSLQAMSGLVVLNGSQFLATLAARVGGGTVTVAQSLNQVSLTMPPPDF